MIRRSNNVSQWVEATILSAKSRRKIIRTTERFVQIAMVCILRHSMCIYSG